MPTHITPSGLVGFGREANCTLDLCSVEYSVFQYVPSLAANSIFIALFVISGSIHLYQGIRSKQWFYMTAAIIGCITEVIGYIGRILLHTNPFDFNDFLIQVSKFQYRRSLVTRKVLNLLLVCLTIAPAFFSASIYVTITKMLVH
jgi:hypothetical protein